MDQNKWKPRRFDSISEVGWTLQKFTLKQFWITVMAKLQSDS